jgi:hypothetical protein
VPQAAGTAPLCANQGPSLGSPGCVSGVSASCGCPSNSRRPAAGQQWWAYCFRPGGKALCLHVCTQLPVLCWPGDGVMFSVACCGGLSYALGLWCAVHGMVLWVAVKVRGCMQRDWLLTRHSSLAPHFLTSPHATPGVPHAPHNHACALGATAGVEVLHSTAWCCSNQPPGMCLLLLLDKQLAAVLHATTHGLALVCKTHPQGCGIHVCNTNSAQLWCRMWHCMPRRVTALTSLNVDRREANPHFFGSVGGGRRSCRLCPGHTGRLLQHTLQAHVVPATCAAALASLWAAATGTTGDAITLTRSCITPGCSQRAGEELWLRPPSRMQGSVMWGLHYRRGLFRARGVGGSCYFFVNNVGATLAGVCGRGCLPLERDLTVHCAYVARDP